MKSNKPIELKIAVLSNFTINGLREEIEKKCKDLSINANIYESGYNQINQDILEPKSNLKIFEPDITFLIINSKFVFEEGEVKIIKRKEERINYVGTRIINFIDIVNLFLQNISGVLIISNIIQTSYSPLGINEDKVDFSVKEWANYFNGKIKSQYFTNDRIRIYDFNSLFLRFGENNIINDKLRYLGDIYVSPGYIPHLCEDLMSYIKPYTSKNKKCIVLDLDNTLWGGIIGEDGINNIKLDDKPPGNSYIEFQKYILALHERGIILAINSKNNVNDALKVIREHPYMILKEKHFACMKINWDNKDRNMIDIARELNIGLDSLVFIDDELINRELVKNSLPEVMVVDLPQDSSLFVKILKSLNDFNTFQITDEDFNRGEYYYTQRQRDELRSKISNIDDFLKSLDMQLEIAKANDFIIPRISQLTKKTNQFNLTTKRYTEERIKEYIEDPNIGVYGINIRDKYGDNGLTGAMILKKEKDILTIDTFLLSCRIIGRNVEKVMLYFIQEYAKKNKLKSIVGEYIPTSKNIVCSDMYAQNGFVTVDGKQFELGNLNKIKRIDYITIIDKDGVL